MAKKSSKQRQKTRQRRAEKRRRKRARTRSRPARPFSRMVGRHGQLRAAAEWPLLECRLTANWREPGEIIQILVARRGPQGQIAVGMFLVDLGCLGIKDAFGRMFSSRREYNQLRREVQSQQRMISSDLNLAAKIIREAIAYADRFGFKPHRDYRQAMPLLGDADPDACDVEIPLGRDGKPFFVAGPYDNVRQIMKKLTKAVGPDGFHFLAPIGTPGDLFD